MSQMTRRQAVSALGCASAGFLAGAACTSGRSPQVAHASEAAGGSAKPPPALAGTHEVVPLPFVPSKLNGLSERMITSHHDNNYAGAVKNLNAVERELSAINADTPGFLVAALQGRELMYRNSKMLHEGYFANLGGNGKRDGTIDAALAEAYGSSTRWEEHFRRAAAGLGGGSGWVVLAYELDTGALRTIAAADHTQSLGLAMPLLVLDMYEHSYHMDFGAAAAQYVDAFFNNIAWEEVNRRFELAAVRKL